MAQLRMLPVATAANSFEARVIAARLGSEGIVWELRGNVDGPFAVGAVDVLVAADDYDSARELLLADDVESSFDVRDEPEPQAGHRDGWWLAAVLAVVILFALARVLTRF